MNIALIDVAATDGGSLSLMNDLITYIKDNDKTNKWFVFTSTVSIEETENIKNIQCPEVKNGWINRLIWDKKDFYVLMKKYNIDLVFSFQNNGYKKKNFKEIVYLHNVLLLNNKNIYPLKEFKSLIKLKMLRPYTRKTWGNADVIIVQGEHVKKQLAKYFPYKKIKVIKPYVSVAGFKTNKRINGFIYPTRPLKYKNIEIIIEALNILKDKGIEPKIIFTFNENDGLYAKKIVKMASHLSNVEFIGYKNRDEILKSYENYGLIYTSDYESFGVPIVEAMKLQTVVVGLDREYIKELIGNYNRVYLANNINELASCILAANKDTNAIENSGNDYDKWDGLLDLVKSFN